MPNASGSVSARFDDDPKLLRCEIPQPRWLWLQLMWLQFEVVRGPVGVVWGRFGAGLGPVGAPSRPQIDRTSDNLKLQLATSMDPLVSRDKGDAQLDDDPKHVKTVR